MLRLEEHFKLKTPEVVAFNRESVDKKRALFGDTSFDPWEHFRNCPESTAFMYHSYLLDIHSERVNYIAKNFRSPVVVQEGGLYSFDVFYNFHKNRFQYFEEQYLEGKMNSLYSKQRMHWSESCTFYLEIDPETAMERIRASEQYRGITLEYLRKMDKTYRSFLETDLCPNKVCFLEETEDPLPTLVHAIEKMALK